MSLEGLRRFRQYLQPPQRKAFDQAMEAATTPPPPPPMDEGGDEDNGGPAEHHVHVHIPPNGAAPNGGTEPPPTDQLGGEGGNDPEKEEIWQAIENLERAVVTGDASAGFADAWPHRDARRARDGWKPPTRDGDEDDEDKDRGEDHGHDQGAEKAPTASNKTVVKAFELEAPPGARGADLRRAHDSRLLVDSMQQLMADMEVAVPGYRFPAFDSRQRPIRTIEQMCRMRRHGLDLLWGQPDGRALIERATRGGFQGTRGLDCVEVKRMFDHVVDLRRVENNGSGGGLSFVSTMPQSGRFGGVTGSRFATPVDMQKQLDEYYAQHKT